MAGSPKPARRPTHVTSPVFPISSRRGRDEAVGDERSTSRPGPSARLRRRDALSAGLGRRGERSMQLTNPVKETLQRGGTAIGVFVPMPSPEVVEVLALA